MSHYRLENSRHEKDEDGGFVVKYDLTKDGRVVFSGHYGECSNMAVWLMWPWDMFSDSHTVSLSWYSLVWHNLRMFVSDAME